jgi:hypothetical protein
VIIIQIKMEKCCFSDATELLNDCEDVETTRYEPMITSWNFDSIGVGGGLRDDCES